MGVYGLTGILSRYAPNAVRNVSCSSFARQTLAIDASCHLNKFIYGDMVPHRHIYGFYQLATFCQLNYIAPIFVFDGPQRLEAKQLEHAKRAKVRRKVKHSLAFEKEQSQRLDAWIEVAEALLCHQQLFPKDNPFDILKEQVLPPCVDEEIENKMRKIAQELQTALQTAQNKEKYTRTVRELAEREDGLVTDMVVNRITNIKDSLEKLKKDNSTMLRSLEKRSYRITQAMRDECQQFLTALGFVCFSCENHEAEAMCANLAKQNRVQGIVSEDLDTLVFGDAPLLRYFFSRGKPILSIDPVKARLELGLSRSSFIDLCILCGTDFSGTIQGIGPHRALQWIRKYGSIENILDNLGDAGHIPHDTFNYKLARLVFDDLPPISSHDEDYQPPIVNEAHVEEMLKYYDIDPVDVQVKLRTAMLTQNVVDVSNWGTNPFASNSTDQSLLQFSTL